MFKRNKKVDRSIRFNVKKKTKKAEKRNCTFTKLYAIP